ncbi:NADH dehydrogenase [ubiquinone] 1 alpha subcomplex subunit 3 isoform X2 [Cynocephalus volans]|uniref:NADH dehydrogenase [ubiquinone] 1 alpha subcomplex subunit 3 isoform X2 n=1 Tax=Cynocephalus volans TaxID=110931 RepID=UPI002FC9EE23
MAARLAAFLKNAWAKEPVLVASFTIGTLAIILPPLSPYTKYAVMINEATPYNYPDFFPSLGSHLSCFLGLHLSSAPPR